MTDDDLRNVGGLSQVVPEELSSHTEADLEPGLDSVDPATIIGRGRQNLEKLTEIKELRRRMAMQSQLRQAADQRLAQMTGQPVDTGLLDPGLVALGAGGASRPDSLALLGLTEGIQGMQKAQQELAKENWARQVSAQNVRANSEQSTMKDLHNQYNIEAGVGQGKAGLRISYYDDKDNNRIQVSTDPYTGETTTKNLGKLRDRASHDERLQEGMRWGPNGSQIPIPGGKFDPSVIASKGEAAVRQEGRVAESKETGKGMGDEYTRIQKSVSSAQNKINLLDRSEELLKDVETNALTPIGMKYAGLSDALGIPLDPKLGHKQAADAIYKQLALESRNPSGGAGMPGAMSDADRDFLGKINPSLTNTPEGRAMIVETSRKLAQRDIDVARMMRDYREKHGNTDRFQDYLAAWSKENPLFGGGSGKAPAAGTRKFEFVGKRP